MLTDLISGVSTISSHVTTRLSTKLFLHVKSFRHSTILATFRSTHARIPGTIFFTYVMFYCSFALTLTPFFIFVLNYIFYHQICISICMKYVYKGFWFIYSSLNWILSNFRFSLYWVHICPELNSNSKLCTNQFSKSFVFHVINCKIFWNIFKTQWI